MDAALPATPPRRSHARYVVLALIAVGTMINYLDRSLLAVAAPRMAEDLALGAATVVATVALIDYATGAKAAS